MRPFTLIDDGRSVDVPPRLAGEGGRLAGSAIEEALGWAVTPRGLRRGTEWRPWPAGGDPGADDRVDLTHVALSLGRPLALDLRERAAYLGVSAAARASALSTLEAPDFTLPDLDGRLHSLSASRGHKVLLVSWASW